MLILTSLIINTNVHIIVYYYYIFYFVGDPNISLTDEIINSGSIELMHVPYELLILQNVYGKCLKHGEQEVLPSIPTELL